MLCELCNVLQALISLDGDSEEEEREEASSGASAADGHDGEIQHALVLPNGAAAAVRTQGGDVRPHKLQFGHLLGTVLQDTQTRLVFRAQYVVEAEVLHYAPGPADLDYPARLAGSGPDKGKRRAVPTLSQWQQESEGSNAMGIVEVDGIPVFRLPPDEILDTWYPTLKKTLWIFSRLHSYVNVSHRVGMDAWVRIWHSKLMTSALARHLRGFRWRGCEPLPTVADERIREDLVSTLVHQARWSSFRRTPSPDLEGGG